MKVGRKKGVKVRSPMMAKKVKKAAAKRWTKTLAGKKYLARQKMGLRYGLHPSVITEAMVLIELSRLKLQRAMGGNLRCRA